MVDKISSQQLNLRNYFVCYVTSFCKILNYFVHIIKRVNFLDYEVFAKQSFTVLTKIGKNKQTNREALLQVNLSYDTEIFNNLFSFGLCLFNSKSSNIANCKILVLKHLKKYQLNRHVLFSLGFYLTAIYLLLRVLVHPVICHIFHYVLCNK